jgi:hypothetical protein
VALAFARGRSDPTSVRSRMATRAALAVHCDTENVTSRRSVALSRGGLGTPPASVRDGARQVRRQRADCRRGRPREPARHADGDPCDGPTPAPAPASRRDNARQVRRQRADCRRGRPGSPPTIQTSAPSRQPARSRAAGATQWRRLPAWPTTGSGSPCRRRCPGCDGPTPALLPPACALTRGRATPTRRLPASRLDRHHDAGGTGSGDHHGRDDVTQSRAAGPLGDAGRTAPRRHRLGHLGGAAQGHRQAGDE